MPKLSNIDAIRGMTRAGRDREETVRRVKRIESEMKKTRGLNHGSFTVGELMEARDRERADPNAGSALLRRRRELPLNVNPCGPEGALGLKAAAMFAGKRVKGVSIDEH